MAHDNLVADFEAYSAWRNNLIRCVGDLQRWLSEQDLNDAQTNMRIQHLIDKLRDDKLSIAFVAEFSRGKSELINAIFFAEYKQRVLPSSAGRTTMCPTELQYDAQKPNAIQLLPIETRATDTTTSEYKRYPEEWTTLQLDIESGDAMHNAFGQVGQKKWVSVADAKRFGLYDEGDPDHKLSVRDGQIEIPCWRHAVINFPHPLLKQGLVILDTPGLNAIGTEPELTLNLLPNAHAILFILAADTGVTKTDIDVWRNHIGRTQGGQRGRLVVLNKIDGLWDSLKTEAQINAEIDSQAQISADLLGINVSQVFPVSAQKGLVAKINDDEELLVKTRLTLLERALSEDLIPSKQEIVRDNTHTEVEDLVLATRGILNARREGVREQLDELTMLRGKNRDVIEHMLDKIAEEKAHFERGMQRFQALRSVFSQQTNVLFSYLGVDNMKTRITQVRSDMEHAQFSTKLTGSMQKFFKDVNVNITRSAEQVAEIQAMMGGMYKKFSEEHGLGSVSPPPFSTLKYHKELSRLERSFNEHFNTGALFVNSKTTLTKKFFETIANRVVYVYEVANRDVDNWLKAVMAPMETQVREHQIQLRRRLESVKRIHKATDTLEDRIGELAEIDAGVVQQLNELEGQLRRAYESLNAPMQKDLARAA